MGRRVSSFYNELGFVLIKGEDRKYTAICKICNKVLQNTAEIRLKAHRKLHGGLMEEVNIPDPNPNLNLNSNPIIKEEELSDSEMVVERLDTSTEEYLDEAFQQETIPQPSTSGLITLKTIELTTTPEKRSSKRKRPKKSLTDEEMKSENDSDSDHQFLVSLLPYLKRVNRNRKMLIRSKLQQVFIDEEQFSDNNFQNGLSKE